MGWIRKSRGDQNFWERKNKNKSNNKNCHQKKFLFLLFLYFSWAIFSAFSSLFELARRFGPLLLGPGYSILLLLANNTRSPGPFLAHRETTASLGGLRRPARASWEPLSGGVATLRGARRVSRYYFPRATYITFFRHSRPERRIPEYIPRYNVGAYEWPWIEYRPPSDPIAPYRIAWRAKEKFFVFCFYRSRHFYTSISYLYALITETYRYNINLRKLFSLLLRGCAMSFTGIIIRRARGCLARWRVAKSRAHAAPLASRWPGEGGRNEVDVAGAVRSVTDKT